MFKIIIFSQIWKITSCFVTSRNEITSGEFVFDAYFGLELLLVVSIIIFCIILMILMAILHPPPCYRSVNDSLSSYQFFRFPSSSTDSENFSGQSVLPSDLDSFYLPADKLIGRDNIRKKIVQTNGRRNNRNDVNLQSTYLSNVHYTDVNRHFPGLHEISRISAGTMARTPASMRVARPYRKPQFKSNRNVVKPLKSILKNPSLTSTLPKNSTFVV
jgi:hypothetical protein